MARRALLVAVLLAAVAAVLWQTGVFGTAAEPVAEVGDDGAAADAVAAPGAGEASALAAGRVGPRATTGGKVIARTPPPATGAPRVTGRVVDATGAAVAGARVVTMSEQVTRALTLEDLGAEGVAAFDAVTGADGRFVVGVAPDAPSHALVALTTALAMAYLPGVRAGDDVTVTVDAAGEVTGVVTDLQGEPVAGATVTWVTFLDAWMVETVATTGAGGAYRLAPVPSMRARGARGTLVTAVHVAAEGFAPLTVAPTPPEPGRTREQPLVLTRGQTVVGKVVDGETDAPVAGARVVAWAAEGWAAVQRPFPAGSSALASKWASPRLGEAVTDAQGAFRIERVPSRGFHPSYSQQWGEDGPQVGFVTAVLEGACATTDDLGLRDEGATQEVVVKVFGATTLTGRVVGADGKPMAKVAVDAVTPGRDAGWLPAALLGAEGPPAIPTTGDDGVYRLVRVPVSRTKDDDVKVVGRVIVRSPAFGRRWSEDGDGTVTVKARAGAPVVVPELVVKPPEGATSLSARVRVLRPDGTPVWGAMVGPVERMRGTNERTDREGVVVVMFASPPQRPITGPQAVRATLSGFAPTEGSVTPTADGTAELTITLAVGRTLTGRVLTADRAPAKDVAVQVGDGAVPIAQVFPEPPAARGAIVPAAALPRTRARFWGSALTDEEGRFTIRDLPGGACHLLAQGPPPAGAPAARPRVTLSDVPTDAADVEVVLPAGVAAPTGGLAGNVRDQVSGRPLVRMTVAVRMDATVVAAAGSGEEEVDMPQPRGSGGIRSLGRFEFTSVPAGTVTLVVTSPQYAPTTVSVVVRAGETTSVPTIELSRGITVRGRVRAPDLGAAGGARHLAFAPLDGGAGGGWRSVEVAPDGGYQQSGFVPGRYRVTSWVEGARHDAPVTVPAEGTVLVVPEGTTTVGFDPTLVVAGTLRLSCLDPRFPPQGAVDPGAAADESRRFAAACRVVVTDGAGTVVAEQTGGFARGQPGPIGWLPLVPGTYKVRVELPGEPAKESSVEVGERQTVELAIGGATPPK
ncbi:MAG: hypothetical protein JNM10_06945 [Planctomycetia bacterium]|nr:hypothetical protein [Planctomycetia bacterium]